MEAPWQMFISVNHPLEKKPVTLFNFAGTMENLPTQSLREDDFGELG